jgi:hypothetical protein
MLKFFDYMEISLILGGIYLIKTSGYGDMGRWSRG